MCLKGHLYQASPCPVCKSVTGPSLHPSPPPMQEAPAGQVGANSTWQGPAPQLLLPYQPSPVSPVPADARSGATSVPPASSSSVALPLPCVLCLEALFLRLDKFVLLQFKIKPFGAALPGFSWGSQAFPCSSPGSGLSPHPRRNRVGGLPGAWARLVAALLLLAVSCSLAIRQLQSRGSAGGSLGSAAPPASGHSHHTGVYHHSAIISPAGECWGRGEQGSLVPGPRPLLMTCGSFLPIATCSHLGQRLLVAGGNVVDAGVGVALCLAVVHPHTTGLGQCAWP